MWEPEKNLQKSVQKSPFESGNPQNVLLVVDFKRSIGLELGTFDFDQGYRIAGAYEKLAKNMAMQLKRLL